MEGQYFVGRRAVPNQELHLEDIIQDPVTAGTVFLDQTATTDRDGRFTFTNVVAEGGLRVTRRDAPLRFRSVWSQGEPVRVEPGATAHVTIGGTGRAVIGRIEPPAGWTKPVDFTVESAASLESDRTILDPLSLFRGKTSIGAEWNDWLNHQSSSPEGREYASRRVFIIVGLASDGSFRIDDVPPGDYRLAIRVNGKSQYHVTATYGRDPGPFGRIVHTFTIPAIPGGRSDVPLDLGLMRLRPRFALQIGAPAPAFEVTTVDGKRLAVPGDFQGKYLLIDFATLWDSQAGIQIARLNDVYQRFGKDPRFAILSVTFAADNLTTRKFLDDKGEPWPQAIVGPLANPISLAYAVDDENVPATILIGPDGQIVAKDLWYDKIGEAVAVALSRAGAEQATSAERYRMNVPTEEDWRSEEWGLDTAWAYKHFYGKTTDEAVQLFAENALCYQEDVMYMPSRVFGYYLRAYINYLLSDAAKGDSDAASCFISLINVKSEHARKDIVPLWPEIEPVLKKLAEHQDDFDADWFPYGCFRSKINEIVQRGFPATFDTTIPEVVPRSVTLQTMGLGTTAVSFPIAVQIFHNSGIDQIDVTSKKVDILRVFGPPDRAGGGNHPTCGRLPDWIRYDRPDCSLHFCFDGDSVSTWHSFLRVRALPPIAL